MPLGVNAISLADRLRTQEDLNMELQRHKIFQPPTPAQSATSSPRRQRKTSLKYNFAFLKELLFWCCLHVCFLLFVWFCLTFYFAVFEEAPIGPCAPRLALSQMVSPGVFNYKILSSKPFQWLFSRAHGGVLSHKAVREKIVNVFLIEEQKIVKKVPEALGKNKEVKWDFSTLNKEIYLPSLLFSIFIIVCLY